jgi:hypothetical protein
MGIEAIIIAAAVSTSVAAAASQGAPSSSTKMPQVAGKAKVDKPAAGDATEADKMNKRLAASSLTKDWGTLKLSKPGLLGLGVQP